MINIIFKLWCDRWLLNNLFFFLKRVKEIPFKANLKWKIVLWKVIKSLKLSNSTHKLSKSHPFSCLYSPQSLLLAHRWNKIQIFCNLIRISFLLAVDIISKIFAALSFSLSLSEIIPRFFLLRNEESSCLKIFRWFSNNMQRKKFLRLHYKKKILFGFILVMRLLCRELFS